MRHPACVSRMLLLFPSQFPLINARNHHMSNFNPMPFCAQRGNPRESNTVWWQIYHSNSPLPLWNSHSFPLALSTPSFSVHFHLFFTLCTLS